MKRYILLIFITLISLTINAQLKKFKVEIPIQPKFKISDSIQSFTILNNSLTPEFQNFINDSLQISFYRKNFSENIVLLDSVASDTTLKTLGDLLFESGRYDIVIPVDRNIKRSTSYTKTNPPLNWDYVDEICKTYNTDALIVLENIAMRTVTNFKHGSEDASYYLRDTYYATIDFYSRVHWRIYDPKEKKILVDYNKTQDTLYWESYEYELLDAFRKLPSIKTASIETGRIIASNFAKEIAPGWKEVSRYYFVMKDAKIDESITLAANGDWENALKNWLNYATTGSKSQQSKIMLNIALALEMTGDLTGAIEWTKKSLNIYYREVNNHYLKELLIRQTAQNLKTVSKE